MINISLPPDTVIDIVVGADAPYYIKPYRPEWYIDTSFSFLKGTRGIIWWYNNNMQISYNRFTVNCDTTLTK